LPTLYAFNEVDFTIRAADPSEWRGDELSEVKPEDGISKSDTVSYLDPSANLNPDIPTREQSSPEPIPDRLKEERRVVVIDPGHGGGDPGALGPQGLQEKDVALAVAKIMEDLLSREKGIDVYLTRSEDSFVPLWERGELATQWKGENPGVFISVHANSVPERPSVRGFETYSLNVARTEHERRVAAIENAPLQVQGQTIDSDSDAEFVSLLRDLSNFGHPPWSVELSSIVQEEIGRFHPGPNRGEKQAPFAVLTNALMPSVLVEVGFLSNEDEALLIAQDQFQDGLARAVARAVMNFFDRYPPGTGEN
jgi:N-acetylmuramoyl-L-alanine amidase